MSKAEEKDLSWIDQAWEYSRMAIENNLPTTIEAFHEYQSKKNVQGYQVNKDSHNKYYLNGHSTTSQRADSDRQPGQQG